MSLTWIAEPRPCWDDGKAAVIEAAPAGALAVGPYEPGEALAGEWWRVEEGGETVGYGWMDITWGDGEMLLAVAPDRQGRGVGSFIVESLAREAAARGLNYLGNVVRSTHPDPERVTAWLTIRGFVHTGDGFLRRRVTAGAEPVSQTTTV